jgi:hypothetical protein
MAAALSSLAMRESDLDKVVPKDQPMFGQKNYVGIFQFRLVEKLNITKSEQYNTNTLTLKLLFVSLLSQAFQ